jgi:hypothetical protein
MVTWQAWTSCFALGFRDVGSMSIALRTDATLLPEGVSPPALRIHMEHAG